MAKRSFSFQSWTPVQVVNTTGFTSAGYMGMLSTSVGQKVNVIEIYLGGQATSSAVNYMIFARDAVNAVNPVIATASSPNNLTGSDQPLDIFTAALSAPIVSHIHATTASQRGINTGLLALSFNSFGGIVRWVAAPGEEINFFGTGINTGEVSLSALGGTPGLMGAHIIYEPS
jgi:hypothetical protein